MVTWFTRKSEGRTEGWGPLPAVHLDMMDHLRSLPRQSLEFRLSSFSKPHRDPVHQYKKGRREGNEWEKKKKKKKKPPTHPPTCTLMFNSYYCWPDVCCWLASFDRSGCGEGEGRRQFFMFRLWGSKFKCHSLLRVHTLNISKSLTGVQMCTSRRLFEPIA